MEQRNQGMTGTVHGQVSHEYVRNNHDNITWARSTKQLLQYLTRDDVRMALGIQTGKLNMSKFVHGQFGRRDDSNCRLCGIEEETMAHMLNDDLDSCTHPLPMRLRHRLWQKGAEIIQLAKAMNLDRCKRRPQWMTDTMRRLSNYVFPSKQLPIPRQAQLIKLAAKAGRIILRKLNSCESLRSAWIRG